MRDPTAISAFYPFLPRMVSYNLTVPFPCFPYHILFLKTHPLKMKAKGPWYVDSVRSSICLRGPVFFIFVYNIKFMQAWALYTSVVVSFAAVHVLLEFGQEKTGEYIDIGPVLGPEHQIRRNNNKMRSACMHTSR